MAKHFINGQWIPAASGETLPVIDPSTGEVFDQLARGNAADIDRAVAAARAAGSAGPGAASTQRSAAASSSK
jgi:aldehyde dehydrogenase (NAD+)